MIAENRDLSEENALAGQHISDCRDYIPPCMHSANAFGEQPIPAYSPTPTFFQAQTTEVWTIPPATASIWPYEEMYRDEVKLQGRRPYDYDKRLQYAEEYFDKFEPDRSLIIYYANYSNPANSGEEQRYLIAGIARLKQIANTRTYAGASKEDREKYGGAFIWQRDITSHYPDQGVRIPYHRYLDSPDAFARIAVFPSNPRPYKYGTRLLSDDDALEVVEQLLDATYELQALGDTSENWSQRQEWLRGLVAELWQSRGVYPGFDEVLKYVGFDLALPYWKEMCERGHEVAAKTRLVSYLEEEVKSIPGLELSQSEEARIRRKWKLRTQIERQLLRDVLPRIALTSEQIKRIVEQGREAYGIQSSLGEVANNPYILCEEYVGDSPDDTLSFSKVDHAVLPLPNLEAEALAEPDDARRLRALCVTELQQRSEHTFLPTEQVLDRINTRLARLPDWKQNVFTDMYFEVDKDTLQPKLKMREDADRSYLYLKSVFDDERTVETILRDLAKRPAHVPRTPTTEAHWREQLTDANCDLNQESPAHYASIVQSQAEVCAQIFGQPIAILTGQAGSGKTNVIKALLASIMRADGHGASFQLLAPTGKAADRLRAMSGKQAVTVHSFLAKRGWLNDNLTFKRDGGERERSTHTIIVDEASMLDLTLIATLFKAIDWNTVKRLILVGDPNQLPPIGRGRVFADLIEWIREARPEAHGHLTHNVRQAQARIQGEGTAILELAAAFQASSRLIGADGTNKEDAEAMLQRVQEGGDVDRDLRVVYWRDEADLAPQLIQTMLNDLADDSSQTEDGRPPMDVWRRGTSQGEERLPEKSQILTPYRSETFGTERLNQLVQEHLHGLHTGDQRPEALDGIMVGDKVIQIRNRPPSRPIVAYNTDLRENQRVEVYNGEIGFAYVHGFDKSRPWGRLERLQVTFARKPKLRVGYGRNLGKRSPDERVEDNLELAYAISIHKAQGSEFERTYLVVPKHKTGLLSTELFYTALTRATTHCTLFVQEDISPLLRMHRRENAHLLKINSSLFKFRPVPDELIQPGSWYEQGRIHRTLADQLVRSKSEVIIANLLFDREIDFQYEWQLTAPDGSFYLPDFTLHVHGQTYYWEHWGLHDQTEYAARMEKKKRWYEQHFPGKLVETWETTNLSQEAAALIDSLLEPR